MVHGPGSGPIIQEGARNACACSMQGLHDKMHVLPSRPAPQGQSAQTPLHRAKIQPRMIACILCILISARVKHSCACALRALSIHLCRQLTKGSALEEGASLGLGDGQVTLTASFLQLHRETQAQQHQGVNHCTLEACKAKPGLHAAIYGKRGRTYDAIRCPRTRHRSTPKRQL